MTSLVHWLRTNGSPGFSKLSFGKRELCFFNKHKEQQYRRLKTEKQTTNISISRIYI